MMTATKLLAGPRLRNLREERGLSQAELARRLGLSPSYLNQLERDRRPLTVAVLLRLTDTFGVDAGFFSAQDDSRLIAELREALADEAVGVSVSAAEITELVAQQPSIARALIELRRRYRDTVAQTSAVLGGQGWPGDEALGAMPHEQVRDFFYDRQNHIEPLDLAAEALATELELTPGNSRLTLARRLRDGHGVRVATEDPGATGRELRRFDPATRTVWLSDQLRPGQQAFQLATQLALLEHGPLLDEIAADGAFSNDRRRGRWPGSGWPSTTRARC